MTEKKVVEKKEESGTNKSEEIRKIARVMKEKGIKPRPVIIVAMLKKQGLAVSSPQVSMVLKRMGFRPRRRKSGKSSAGGVATHANVARKAGPGRREMISVEDLLAAKKLVSQFGGADRALAAIAVLKRFES